MAKKGLLLIIACMVMTVATGAQSVVHSAKRNASFLSLTETEGITFPYTYGMHTYLKGGSESWQHYFEQMKAHGFNYVEVQPEGYGSGSAADIKSGCEEVVAAIKNVGLTVWSIHLPYGNSYDISLVNEADRKAVVRNLSTYIRTLCEVYQPRYLVLHPSGEPEPTGSDREKHIEQAAKSVKELSKVAQENGAVICVECLPRTCLGNTPEELLRIVTPTPEARICFDTNHNLLQTYNEFIQKAGHLIATVHISDYDYNDEKHWLPGLGKIAWGDLLMCLEECGYKGVLMSESDKTASGWAVPSTTHEAFNKIIKEYEDAKSSPAVRTAMFLRNMRDFHWGGESPEKSIIVGMSPGEYPAEKANPFLKLYHDTEAAIDASTASAEEFKAMRENLIAEYNDLKASVNKMEEGLYHIINANDGFKERNKKMGMYSDEEKVLKWKSLEASSRFLFEIKKTGNETYSIRNVGNGCYIGAVQEQYTAVPMTATHQVDQCIEPLGNGAFRIYNAENSTSYHSQGHSDGAGTSGIVVLWDSNPLKGSSSSWEFERVNTSMEQQFTVPADGYTTLYLNQSIKLPEGLEAGYVTGMDAASRKVNVVWAYTNGAVIPSGTPMVVRGVPGTYYYESAESAETAPTDNLLKGTLEDAMTEGDGCVFYRLTKDTEGMVFAWGADNGVAFENPKGEAYLALPSDEAASFSKLYFYHNASVAPRFAVISDIHVGSENSDWKVPGTMKFMFNQGEPLDALFICGDLTDGGQAYQYDALKALLDDKTLVPANVPVYILMGNHDNYNDHSAERYLKLGQPLHQYIDIKGYPFITISTRGTSNSGNSNHDEEAYNFLSDKLADAAANYPGKPIFVFTHIPPEGTVYGANDWGNPRINEIMSKYPQVVVFSGHTHFPLGDPRSISQIHYTAINDGTSTYSEILAGELTGTSWPEDYDTFTEGVIVNVDAKSNVDIERWCTSHNEQILPNWSIPAPHDGSQFLYAGRTGGEKPAFNADAKVSVAISGDSCTVGFQQAKDDEVVRNYLIEIVDGSKVLTTFSLFSGFYLNSRMPEVLYQVFTGLPEEVNLVARVTAVDSYEQKSAPIVSEPFRLKAYEPAPGTSAPKANLFDVEFRGFGGASDVSPAQHRVLISSSRPTTSLDKEHNRYYAYFKGDQNCFYRINYEDDQDIKNAFVNGFALELYYKPGSVSGTYDPFCSTENGGAGLEQSNADIQFWCYINGYKQVTCSNVLKKNEWCHVVASYDKENESMVLYVNGKSGVTLSAPGTLELSDYSSAHWFGIGGDCCQNNYVQNPLLGRIMIARMYDRPLTRDDVYWLYKEAKEGKTTGIDAVEKDAKQADDKIYDMAGRFVINPQSGVYVSKGQKVMVIK